MKHYLIGAFSSAKAVKGYFDTLHILGDSVEPIVVQYQKNDKFEEVDIPFNVKLIKIAKNYPGNTGKHKDFREVISPFLVGTGWVIFTDMHDVVFQNPLPDFPNVNILLASEGKKFGEIPFWCELFPDTIYDKTAYNVGCFAMRVSLVKEFWDYLHKGWMNFFDWYKNIPFPKFGDGMSFPFTAPAYPQRIKNEIAMIFNGYYDTLCYNEFISDYESKVEVKGLFGIYAFNYEVGNLIQKDGLLFNKDGSKISIAHYNGDSKNKMKGGN